MSTSDNKKGIAEKGNNKHKNLAHYLKELVNRLASTKQ